MSLTVKDLEKLQELSSDYRMEWVNREVIVMSPSGYESEEITKQLAFLASYLPMLIQAV